ncbi:hypothetical protein ACIO3O_08380 [Streptomyces sp. NPDC087440]|uniref:hypothetical protein n=1 Tax=Streptomyces sp. NPDC087440 TaxID=3365790 RepID=UPI0038170A8A
MDPGTHFVFGTHKNHGIVAAFTPTVSSHLADWLLVREQFQPVPGETGLYRLTEPERDGIRRALQAAQDLRGLGYAVHTDADLAAPGPALHGQPRESRARSAQAAANRSPQRGPALTTSPPRARPIPPKPTAAPSVHMSATTAGRGR